MRQDKGQEAQQTNQTQHAESDGKVSKFSTDTLNSSCEVLFSMLQANGGQLLKEVASSFGVPLWMIVAGLIQRAIDNGEHTAPMLDPIWLHAQEHKMEEFVAVVCARCNNTFKPRWPGQVYCNNTCGSLAASDKLVRKPKGVEVIPTSESTITGQVTDIRSDSGSIGDVHAVLNAA